MDSCFGLIWPHFFLVDLRGNARYHVAIVPNEWLSAYLNTCINLCGILVTRSRTSHKLHISVKNNSLSLRWELIFIFM